jgi:hypothetical protein
MKCCHKSAVFGCVLVKAVEDYRTPQRSALNDENFMTRDSVLECGSPQPLCHDLRGVAQKFFYHQ